MAKEAAQRRGSVVMDEANKFYQNASTAASKAASDAATKAKEAIGKANAEGEKVDKAD